MQINIHKDGCDSGCGGLPGHSGVGSYFVLLSGKDAQHAWSDGLFLAYSVRHGP